jgi:ADP-heptose:LPS heptosyltransferase
VDEQNVSFTNLKPRVFTPVSDAELAMFGVSREPRFVQTLEDLREDPPNIVISECVKDTSFMQNQFKKQTIYKKNKYVCSLSVYHQLHYNPLSKERILKPASIQFKKVYKPYRGEDLTNKAILFWRTGGIGDLLFIKPIMIYLKEKFENCTIMFACGPQYQPMVETWNCIDKLMDLPFNVTNLWRADYHAVFEGVIERCKEAHTTNCYRLFTKWLSLEIPDDKLIPKQAPKEDKVDYCRNILKEWGLDEKSFIIIQPRASSPIRTPSPEFWKKVINRITKKYKIIITDSPKQNEMMEQFIKILDSKDSVYNFCNFSKGIDDTIALTSLAKGVVATDTALNHIAISLGVKAFGIFGPFPSYIRLDTYPKDLCSSIDGKIGCSPCYLHGHRPCPTSDTGGHSKCYEQINIDEFENKFEELMNK